MSCRQTDTVRVQGRPVLFLVSLCSLEPCCGQGDHSVPGAACFFGVRNPTQALMAVLRTSSASTSHLDHLCRRSRRTQVQKNAYLPSHAGQEILRWLQQPPERHQCRLSACESRALTASRRLSVSWILQSCILSWVFSCVHVSPGPEVGPAQWFFFELVSPRDCSGLVSGSTSSWGKDVSDCE